ncbi:zinc ribbon domain-containing protein [Methanobacterium alcaliphilum]|uniref:zinc ribbon domain-containing protein n=1 Tax=Methanobacterium alcaliphilum TaxID=392018 RepID=UPI00200AAF06|nr:zinc ribbon domain-containing protein [Methanobacterium alcaliphilum]MCK9151822.1 zinc ribbon domain-containing protein [Methanobacterium alcaliphilum]
MEGDKNSSIKCPECGAKVPDGKKFCGECGKPIKKIEDDSYESEQEIINCPRCDAELELELKFCTECGEKIDQIINPKQMANCPNCDTIIGPKLTFCTNCGTKIKDNKTIKKESKWMDSISKSSKTLMKGMDEFINSATDSLDKNINQSRAKQKGNGEQFKPVRIKGIDNPNPGFLVCNTCGGVYKLKSCESVDDFSEDCTCGGKLTHLKNLPKPTRPYRSI